MRLTTAVILALTYWILPVKNADAAVVYQLQTTNLFCVVDQYGPYLEIDKADGSFLHPTFQEGFNITIAKKKNDQRLLTTLKKQLKTASGKRKASLKKKINNIKADIVFWSDVGIGIVSCEMQPPLPLYTDPNGSSFFGKIPISSFFALSGGAIIANDGQYLGIFSSSVFVTDSIANTFNNYGNQFSPQSIFNQFGNYGSNFSTMSPWNQFATSPPVILVNGQAQAYLTVNPFKAPRVDPYDLLTWLGR